MNESIGLVARDGQAIALRGAEVDARILGLVAETTLSQRYRNDTGTNLEVAYTFPLPVDGVLLDFVATLGGRAYHGHVMPRREAETNYEQAVEEGDAAFRLQKVKAGLYTATLGNLKPGEEVEIRLRFGETLRWQAGRLRYRLPTVIAPRHGEPTGMQPWQRPVTDLGVEYAFALRVQVLGDLARAAFECPTHRVAFSTAEHATTLTLVGAACLDRDFVLDIRTGERRCLGASAEALGTRVALINLMPPAIQAEQPHARDAVLLLDCSGSMAGDSIAHAKAGVILALNNLKPADRFAVIGFGSDTLAFDRTLQPANRKNLQLAKDFVDHLPDLGGTEMGAALELALSYQDNAPLDILLLTDGECWDLDAIAGKAKDHGARIFSLGIGSAVAEDTVRMLANTTGGACELITPDEDMAERVAAHFNRMRQPRITGLEIDWSQTPAWEARSQEARFAGDSCLVWAELNEAVGEVRAALQLDEGPSLVETIPLDPAGQMADTLVRVAAAARLPALSGQAYLEWSLRFQLVTEETDYLVVMERAEADKSTGMPELQVVPQMLAAGWGGTGTVVGGGDRFSPVRGNPNHHDEPQSFRLMDMDGDYDMASPMRFSNRQAAPVLRANWAAFVAALEKSAGAWLRPALPASLKGLARLGAPGALIAALRALIDKGKQEADVVRTALFLLQEYLAIPYRPRTLALLARLPPAMPGLTKDVREALDQLDEELWEAGEAFADAGDTPDTPAFLRRAQE